MPCDTVTTIGIKLGKVDPERLGRAAAEIGYTVGKTRAGGLRLSRRGIVITVEAGGAAELSGYRYAVADNERIVAELKRAMAATTVSDAMRRFGFRVKSQQATATGTKMRIGR